MKHTLSACFFLQISVVVIRQGQTGFPFIDAIMRQLCKEGWISSLARQVVGSFLTQGCMWMSWEEGFKVKKILLIKVALCSYYDLLNIDLEALPLQDI